MYSLETLDVDVTKFKEDSYEASFILCDDYFEGLDGAEIQRGEVRVQATVDKAAAGEYVLRLVVDGAVTVSCDRCLDDMQQPIKGESAYTVRLGHANVDDDDVIWVDEQEGTLSLAWPIYETIALSVPIKHVHAPGQCNDAMTQKLNELSATRSGDEADEAAIDPRWEQLSKLKK